MKVAILGNYPTYPFAEKLGVKYQGRKVTTWLINFTKYLSKYKNIELHVISEDEYLSDDVNFFYENINFHFIKCPKRFKAATLFMGDIIRIKKVLNKVKPDIVNAHHTDEYALTAIKSDFPYVITVHGIFSRFIPEGKLVSREKIVSRVEKYVLKRAKNLIASSPFVYEAVEGITNAKFFDVENCLDEKYFDCIKDYSINFKLVFIGTIIGDKGVHFLVQAVDKLKFEFPNISLTIIGVRNNNYYENLLEYIIQNNLGDKIKFTGFITEEEKLNILTNSTILVHPSRLETFCMAVAEAMATGTPIIATRVGGLPYTVGNEDNAILVDYGSVDGLVESIKKLFYDDLLRMRMGINARNEALNRFHPSVAIPNLIRCFDMILKNESNKKGN